MLGLLLFFRLLFLLWRFVAMTALFVYVVNRPQMRFQSGGAGMECERWFRATCDYSFDCPRLRIRATRHMLRRGELLPRKALLRLRH
jgi:hypothetical protein